MSPSRHNLLSRGIIDKDGKPGPNFQLGAQQTAKDTNVYNLEPNATGPYKTLPQPQTTYATGVPQNVADTRFPANLPNGPFQITKYVDFNDFTGDPVHRFFQMWQQTDNGRNDLFVWVGVQTGIGPQNTPPAPTPGATFQGREAMGFYNMQTGDAPVFKNLADNYAISDNYHQAVMGGTGANFFALITGDVAFYINGKPKPPLQSQVEDPNPLAGTNNFYNQDGYAGGSYVDCSDLKQPGVKPIINQLNSLPNRPAPNCDSKTYYLVNNYNPAYSPTGALRFDPTKPTNITSPQVVPPIAEALTAKGISWKWYTGGRNGGNITNEYCRICDPFTHLTAVMTTGLINNLQDVTDFYNDVTDAKKLPAVSFVRPFESQAGHPADSNPEAYETFVADLIKRVQANPEVWAKTAILVTYDEGGGYYDSGYIQALDFFGDGTRTVLLAVSPFAKKGHVDHTYADHVSILKFIEKNWGLSPLSDRSRDNLPNPIQLSADPYEPVNGPAIGDLTSLFDFGAGQ
jgi:phospholipase C